MALVSELRVQAFVDPKLFSGNFADQFIVSIVDFFITCEDTALLCGGNFLDFE